MHIETLLQKIGLTQNEVKVYLTLLRIGKSTSYTLIKESEISSGKIYETLDKLIQRGLVSYVLINNRKNFLAADPERLIDFLMRKEKELHQDIKEVTAILPELRLKNKLVEDKVKAEVYENIEGIKTVYELMLKEAISGEKFFILGAPSEAGEKLDYYFDNFNKRRIEKNISLKIILNHGHLRESKLKSLEKTQVKVFPKHIATPAWINIFGDYVATFNLQDKPIAFVLKSSKTADSYRQYFDLMWKNAN